MTHLHVNLSLGDPQIDYIETFEERMLNLVNVGKLVSFSINLPVERVPFENARICRCRDRNPPRQECRQFWVLEPESDRAFHVSGITPEGLPCRKVLLSRDLGEVVNARVLRVKLLEVMRWCKECRRVREPTCLRDRDRKERVRGGVRHLERRRINRDNGRELVLGSNLLPDQGVGVGADVLVLVDVFVPEHHVVSRDRRTVGPLQALTQREHVL